MSPSGDRELVAALLAAEQEGMVAYREAVAGGRLGRVQSLAALFAQQQERHAEALADALRRLGRRSQAPHAPDGLLDAVRAGRDPFLRFAAALEDSALRGLYEAHGRLRLPSLVGTAAGIMGNRAQHLTALRAQLGEQPLGEAFVRGSR